MNLWKFLINAKYSFTIYIIFIQTYFTPSIFSKSISRSSNDKPWGTESIIKCIDSLNKFTVVIMTIMENNRVHKGSRNTAFG